MPADVARVKEVFLAVLELPTDGRAAYLDTACAGDTELRQRIEAMLRSHENTGELLTRSPAEMLQSSVAHGDAVAAGSPAAGENKLSFLTPSAKPEHLGSLGRYDVQKILGQGGFGIVLKGFDERLHRVVAIKVLLPAYAAIGSARKRFIREARAAAAVKNEHVVGIHDVQETAEPPYLVMEFVDGISLQDKIDKHGPLGPKEILRIGMQIAEGLAAAHKQGLVHRDIKPANILLENGVERVKITDFGLARAVDDASVTQSGMVAGTPMYMSPEQAEGLPIDYRSDLFSLGSVLYTMGTGHPPFRATGTHAVLKRVIEASPRPIREVNSEISDWLEDIIARLHARKPEERIQTAQEVAQLLGQNLAHLQQPSSVPVPSDVPVPGNGARVATESRPARQASAGTRSTILVLSWLCVWFSVAVLLLYVSDHARLSIPDQERIQPLATGAAAIFLLTVAGLLVRSCWRRQWRRCLGAVVLLVAGSLAFTEVVGFTCFFHTPVFEATVTSDDPHTMVRIWKTTWTDPPVNLGMELPGAEYLAIDVAKVLGEPAHAFETIAATEIVLPAGTYLLQADLDGHEVQRMSLRLGTRDYQIHDSPVEEPDGTTRSGGGSVLAAGTNWQRRIQLNIPADAILLKKEKARLRGSWRAVAGKSNGEVLPKELVDQIDFRLTFTNGKPFLLERGTNFELWNPNEYASLQMCETRATKRIEAKGGYVIQSRRKPAHLDLPAVVFDGKPMQAIYRFKGDELHLCFGPGGRPTDFSGPGAGTMFFVLQRDDAGSTGADERQ